MRGGRRRRYHGCSTHTRPQRIEEEHQAAASQVGTLPLFSPLFVSIILLSRLYNFASDSISPTKFNRMGIEAGVAAVARGATRHFVFCFYDWRCVTRVAAMTGEKRHKKILATLFFWFPIDHAISSNGDRRRTNPFIVVTP